MSTSTPDEPNLDPFDAHFRRDPVGDADVRVIVLAETDGAEDEAQSVSRSLEELLTQRGRSFETTLVDLTEAGWNAALARGLQGATTPLVLVTCARAPWTSAHLDPLLDAINHCD